MTSKNLSRRLEELEGRETPISVPDRVIEIKFVAPGGEVVDTRVIKFAQSIRPKGGAWRSRHRR